MRYQENLEDGVSGYIDAQNAIYNKGLKRLGVD